MMLRGGFACGQDGCENGLEQDCQKCGAPRCSDHIARCIHCWQLANFPTLFCHSCAADHERTKFWKGQCVDQWNATMINTEDEHFLGKDSTFGELQQRRAERYKQRGLL